MTVSLFILCLKMSVKALTKLDLVSSYDFFYSAKILIHSLLFSPNDPGSKQAGRPPKKRGASCVTSMINMDQRLSLSEVSPRFCFFSGK